MRSIVYSRHLVPPPLKCGGVHQSLELHKGIIRCHTFCDFVSSSSFCDFAPSATSHLLRFIKACSAGRLGSMTGLPRYVPCILLWTKQYIVKNSCVWVYAILSRAQILYASTTTSLFWALLMCAVPFAADFNGSLKSHPGDA